jgi:biopolymer transport protein ExbD
MTLKKKKRKGAEIPTSSMSDIAFLLLVFFLTTTKFDTKQGVGLVLPRAVDPDSKENVKLNKKNLTRILVNTDGSTAIVIGESTVIEPIDVPMIEPRVKQLIAQNPSMVITIITDRGGKYTYMVRVLEQLRLAGAEKISLATN